MQRNEYLLSTKLVHSSFQERGREWGKGTQKPDLGQHLSLKSACPQSGGSVRREEGGLAREKWTF